MPAEKLRGAAREAMRVKLRALYDGGMTTYEIGAQFGKSQTWAHRLLTEAGTVFRPTGVARPGKRPAQQSKRTFGG